MPKVSGTLLWYGEGAGYIGDKDRGYIVELLYALLRHHARLGWWLAKRRSSMLSEENEEQVVAFIAGHPAFFWRAAALGRCTMPLTQNKGGGLLGNHDHGRIRVA